MLLDPHEREVATMLEALVRRVLQKIGDKPYKNSEACCRSKMFKNYSGAHCNIVSKAKDKLLRLVGNATKKEARSLTGIFVFRK